MARLVKVKSMSGGRVGLVSPGSNLRVIWEKRNAIRPIEFDKLQMAIYDPGVEYLFRQGLLYIEDMQDKIDLGLEDPDTKIPTNVIALSDKDMERYLSVMAIFDFKEKVKKLPKEQVLALVDYAIAHEKMDMDKAELLKELTGIDIISAVKLNRDDKKE